MIRFLNNYIVRLLQSISFTKWTYDKVYFIFRISVDHGSSNCHLTVTSTIQLQPLQNRQALAQNITLANKSGNLTGLMIALNTVGVNNNSINNISSTLHGEEQQQQSPLSITQSMRDGI